MATIMIVEDSPTIAAGLQMILEPEGFQTVVAEDGLSAFNALSKHHPELILMDIGLPGIQGTDLCAWIRQFPAYALIPIIIVTGSHRHIDYRLAQQMGANGYITKPVNPEELLSLINQNLAARAV
jgi:CheY-like chemotaxis protein